MAPAPSPAATGAATAAAAAPTIAPVADPIKIPSATTMLPTGKATLHWVDSGDSKATFLKAFFAKYQQAHPNITIQYDPLPGPEIAKVVPAGIQGGNAPDIFQTPPGITAGQMVKEGWIRPWDDVIPNFAQWKTRFPPNKLVEGVTVFSGKTYGAGYLSARQYNSLLMYNVAYMQAAGYDPSAKPLTFDEYRAAAKKITQAGAGKYYGVLFDLNQADVFGTVVGNLARMGGSANIGDIDLRTGIYAYNTDPYLAAVQLLLALKADGSVFPDSVSLNTPQAQARFAQNVAGMFMGGPFNIPQWKRDSPDFKFGVGSQPIPTSGTPLPLAVGPGPFIPVWLYTKSANRAIAGDLLDYITSEDGQRAEAILTQGFPPPLLPVGQVQGLEPLVLKAYDLFKQQLRTGPSPVVRNPDVTLVELERKSVAPNFGTVVQGIYTGQLSDAKKALQDLQDRSEAELDRAIKAAQAKGAKVSRDNWKFPNWDPMRDYTDADYAALTK